MHPVEEMFGEIFVPHVGTCSDPCGTSLGKLLIKLRWIVVRLEEKLVVQEFTDKTSEKISFVPNSKKAISVVSHSGCVLQVETPQRVVKCESCESVSFFRK